MAVNCGVSFGICRLRATKVDVAGNVVNEPDNTYTTSNVKSVGFNPNITTGQTFEARNGCGCSVARFKANDTFNHFEFNFVNQALEPELESLLLGQTPIFDGADAVGLRFGGALDCDDDEPAVALEFWSQHVVGGGPDGLLPWIHWVFSKTVWQIGQRTAEEGIQEPALSGFSRTNTQWGDGPFGDGPPDGLGVDEGAYWKTADEPPTAACAAGEVEPGS